MTGFNMEQLQATHTQQHLQDNVVGRATGRFDLIFDEWDIMNR